MRYEFVVILVILAVIIVVKLNAAKIKGFIGEFKVNLTLKFLGKNFITLSDVLIKNSNNETSQIDHVVLSEYGIFI